MSDPVDTELTAYAAGIRDSAEDVSAGRVDVPERGGQISTTPNVTARLELYRRTAARCRDWAERFRGPVREQFLKDAAYFDERIAELEVSSAQE